MLDILKEIMIFGKWLFILVALLILILFIVALVDYFKQRVELNRSGDIKGYAVKVGDEYVVWKRTATQATDWFLENYYGETPMELLPMTKKEFLREKNGKA